MLTAYLAKEGFEELLIRELNHIKDRFDNLVVAEGAAQKVFFAQNIWYDVEAVPFSSIAEAAKLLRARGALWALHPNKYLGRSRLIQEKLPYFSPKPIVFPGNTPKATLGSWTLINENLMLVSTHCLSPFASGQPIFVESKVPPSRAYLKLWEALLLEGIKSLEGQYCLDIGASPGSWTWALCQLGAKVYAVDRAPLDPAVQALDSVTAVQKDAFSLQPKDFPQLDWIFSDVICYPEKLLSWIKIFIAANPTVQCICTLKFQGDGGYGVVKDFLEIPYSKVRYLYHNKHELCWIYRP
jgi:23S rRNA (cytidine2498-2'-O)-methyltransferase